HPFLFRKRLGTFDRRARHGDLVQLTLDTGEVFGYGLFNPRAEITVRLLTLGTEPPREEWWSSRLADAVALRRDTLQLDAVTNACRLVHAEGDGLSGFIADKFGDVLSIEVFGLAIYQRVDALAAQLAGLCGAKHWVVRCGPQSLEHEGFHAEPYGSPGHPGHAMVTEFGTKFRVDFEHGHKTGFFCDQRDNRRAVAQLCSGKNVLDACCYTGGFAIQASVLGKAAEVTGVDLDEQAIETARTNAKLNQRQIKFVHADAFPYLRDMQRNERTYDVVVLDPPKFIRTREGVEEGRQKYFDLNRLAMQLVAPGGWLVTCTCSGLLGAREFQQTVSAAVPGNRRARILNRTGAAPDHPIAANCLETEYLQALWLKLD
ncbi:MAG: class I SAM-dependent rRNA methyltransferase, partial [Planctomycetaceae bacterium]|nr:class I SAM-dependent rRNA methyltransferase [Planctomycetaceae bacterium]